MSRVISTTAYVTDTDSLVGEEYTIGESVYLNIEDLKVTNTVGDGVTDIGVIGEVVEAPVLTDDPLPRMVVRLSVAAELLSPVKRLLQSVDL